MPVELTTWAEMRAIDDGLDGDYVLMNAVGTESVGYDTYASSSANSGSGWIPIGQFGDWFEFTGKFDGGGYEIDGLFINSSLNYAGFFWRNAATSEWVNIRLTNASVTTSGSRAGILAGTAWDDGVVRDCFVSGSAAANNAAGGMFGVVQGSASVARCYSTATATATTQFAGSFAGIIKESAIVSDCFATGDATAANQVGGFWGDIDAGSPTITRCYSVGKPTGDGAHGLGGKTGGGGPSISACFWDAEASETATSTYGTGKTTAQMKTMATFVDAGWDIVEGVNPTHVWGIHPEINDGYPFLQAFQSAPPSNPRRRTAFFALVGQQF
jgi:hypothetical protein